MTTSKPLEAWFTYEKKKNELEYEALSLSHFIGSAALVACVSNCVSVALYFSFVIEVGSVASVGRSLASDVPHCACYFTSTSQSQLCDWIRFTFSKSPFSRC